MIGGSIIKAKHFIVVGMICILVIVIYILNEIVTIPLFTNEYEANYFEKTGVNYYTYEGIIKGKGTPREERIEKASDGYVLYVVYEGYQYTFFGNPGAKKENYLLGNVKIWDKNYKVGRFKIGVGSSQDDVQKAYRKKTKIKEAECGFVDGVIWVKFALNPQKEVSSITISLGP